jgi:membrane protein YdbS with pleckstrin-like domain
MARYVDSLLIEGEQSVLRTRPHWLSLMAESKLGWGLWILAIVWLVGVLWFNVAPGPLRDLSGAGIIVLVLIGLAIFAWRYWHWWATDYVVTNRRLLKVTGILNKRSTDSSLEKINDAILSQSFLGRIFNFGTLEILTAADVPNDVYEMLNDPKGFKKTVLTQKHALETEYAYGRQPTPPLRAEVPMPPPPPAAAPAPAPAPAPALEPAVPVAAAVAESPVAVETPVAEQPARDESVEVTETLSRLADLRDEGAISAEEYEQKKDELLGRL